jgi:hypothetical protein
MEAQRRALHLSRRVIQLTVFKGFLTSSSEQGRAPVRDIGHARALHLYRPGVASVTPKRCISPQKCRFSL